MITKGFVFAGIVATVVACGPVPATSGESRTDTATADDGRSADATGTGTAPGAGDGGEDDDSDGTATDTATDPASTTETVTGTGTGARPDRATPMRGVWISREELAALPTSGPAWTQLLAAAGTTPDAPNLSDQDQMTNVMVLAKAYVYGRTGAEEYRTQVIDAVMAAIGTEVDGETLALGRELAAYVIAADVVGLPPAEDARFRAWLRTTLTEDLDGRTLRSTHEDRPNNWGTHAGASRAAVAVYLGDDAEIERTATVFRGWLGDRAAYAGFKYGELSWQADPDAPVGINPKGATKDGRSVDGVIPDDMRRGDVFQFPPVYTNYPWGGLEGALVQAEILYRAGYDTWRWGDEALRRAVQFLYDIDWGAEGDDEWQPWVVNRRYGTSFPVEPDARPGKNMGWTNWTHAR